jgi:hypothetical protein
MKKLIAISLLSLVLSGCAGLGFEKKATLMPDTVGVELDANPRNGYRSNEITGRASWNLK